MKYYFVGALIGMAFLLGLVRFYDWTAIEQKKEKPPTAIEQKKEKPPIQFAEGPPQTIQIWFNHESQAAAIKVQHQKHEFYDLIFFFSIDTEKIAENSDNIVECRLNRDFVEGFITKKYMGEIAVPANKCRELKP